ncbi:MAG: DUF2155 domain-containing protein [Caulobacter sp.]|nr:DUF2155 domain-containing protein [Caulobacter sp.]
MTMRRSLAGVAAVALAGSLMGGGAWALQNAPQQPPAAPTAPTAPTPRQPPTGPGATPIVPKPGVTTTTSAPPAATTTTAPAQPQPQAQPQAQPAPIAKSAAPTEPDKPAEPLKRARSSVAILQALDKVTTETMRFEAPVGQPIRYKTLVFTVRACETTAPDEDAPDSIAYVTVDTQPKALPGRVAPPGRQIFKGWMYANSPGLNPLEHPVYDAWLIACKTSAPVAPAASR